MAQYCFPCLRNPHYTANHPPKHNRCQFRAPPPINGLIRAATYSIQSASVTRSRPWGLANPDWRRASPYYIHIYNTDPVKAAGAGINFSARLLLVCALRPPPPLRTQKQAFLSGSRFRELHFVSFLGAFFAVSRTH